MMRQMRTLVCWLTFSASVVAADRPCSTSEAQRAETEASSVRSWDNLYKSYQSYRQCDDGAIGEGYSESVARILVDRWDTLTRLAKIAREDPDFKRFVLKHVDDTLNDTDVKKIRANATAQCPASLRTLCQDLKKQTK